MSKHRKKKRQLEHQASVTQHSKSEGPIAASSAALTQAIDVPSVPRLWLILGGLALLATFLWSYWPTLKTIVGAWIRQPDYSHGFIVLPVAMVFLWARRSSFPSGSIHPSIAGAGLLLLAGLMRVIAGLYFLQPLDGWTIPICLAGAVWLLLGWRCLRWSLPSIAFLWFLVPIPYSAERWLSLPLQKISTKLSTISLQMLGQPAISEGNTIWLGDQQLFIEEACSGMRIFVGIFALAFAYVLFTRWNWWQKLLVLVAAVPVAIVANVTRIVVTGLLYQFVSGEAAHKFSHDIAGLVMIPLAAALFWLFLVYLDRLLPEVEEISPIGYGSS